MKKLDSAEPEPRRRSLEGGRQTHHTQVGSLGDLQMSPSLQIDRTPDEDAQSSWEIPLQEHLSTVDFPPAQQGNSHLEEDVLWDCFGSPQGSSRAAKGADQQLGGQWTAESTPSASGEGPGDQRSYTSSGTEGIIEHFSIFVDEFDPKEQQLESLFPDLSPLDSLTMEVKAKGDGEGSLKDQRKELRDSVVPQQKPRRRSLEVGGETLHLDVGYPGKLPKSPSPRKIKRPNEDPQAISLQKCPNAAGSPRAEQGSSPVAEDCFEGFLPGRQLTAESISGASGEAPGAQRSCASSGTEEHFPILVESSEPKVPEVLEERSLTMEVMAKEDKKIGLKDQRTELKKHGSSESQQKPWRRSLEFGRETLHPKDGYPGNIKKSPSPRKIKRPNEDPQSSHEISLKDSLDTVACHQAKQNDSQVAEDCFEGFQPAGQSAAKSMPGVSGEAPGPQRNCASSGTEEHFPIVVEPSEPKVPEVLEKRSLKRKVKAKGGGKAGLKGDIGQGRKDEMETVQWGEPEQSDLTGSSIGRKRMTSQAAEIQEASQQGLESCAQLGPMKREADQSLSETTSCLREIRDREYSENLGENSNFFKSAPVSREKKTSICPNCGKFFTSILLRHKQSHKGEMTHKCSHCGDFFSRCPSLSKHEETRKQEKPHKCSHCEKCFSTSSGLSVHQRIHTGVKQYKCSHCEKYFRTRSELSIHERTHTGEKPYICSQCGKCFSSSSNLSTHERIHTGVKPHKCPHCEKCFSNSSDLLTHVRTHTGEKPYKCSHCGKCFSTSSGLSMHKQIHTGVKPYKCSQCEKCFRTRSDLSTHERTHTGEKPYTCSHCGKCCSTHSNLSAHVRIHTGEKPYKCPHCEKCFRNSSHLSKHVRTHTGEKPFQCSHCGKCFSTSSDRFRHERIHTGEKPHKCSECVKCFSTHSALLKHEQIHKGEKPHKCSECGRSFRQSADLKSHMEIHTKQTMSELVYGSLPDAYYWPSPTF